MMRSMFSGVTGLRTHQSRMDVIAHNIANVNTTGFKSSRMTFAEAFSQTIQGASAPNPVAGRGGTNPMQVGLGVNVSSIQRMMTPGAAQRTDDPLHLMIQDDGFFVVGDNVSGLFFTRAGDFQRDEEWNIHMPNGMMLQGWPAAWHPGGAGPERNAETLEPIGPVPGMVQGISISPEMRMVPPLATGNVRMTGNLRPADAVNRPIPSTINFQDSLGTEYRLQIQFVLDGYDWVVQMADHMVRTSDNARTYLSAPTTPPPFVTPGLGTLPPPIAGWHNLTSFTFTDGGNPYMPTSPPVANINDGFVMMLDINDMVAGSLPPGVNFGQNHPGQAAAAPTMVRLDFRQMTQFDSPSGVTSRNMDGLSAGTLMGISVGSDGIITGTYSNGQTFDLWQIALARFENPAGLMAMGGNLFARTANSGDFDGIGVSVANAGTSLLGGTLEMSNVDLAAEFTEMITTQRGFQANSRIISTSDEMLQELVNLRR